MVAFKPMKRRQWPVCGGTGLLSKASRCKAHQSVLVLTKPVNETGQVSEWFQR